MSLISLITDFGLEDNFVGVMKGIILKINPSARIIDICHQIEPQDTQKAAFILRSSYNYFPKGTVHLVVVDPGVGSNRKKLLVKTKNYFFVAPDNGVLSLALEKEPPVKIIEISAKKYFLKPLSDTFHARDIFAPVSARLSKDTRNIERFGRLVKSFKDLKLPQPKIDSKNITGEIIYIDHFGNLVSNIDKDTLNNFVKGRKFKVRIQGEAINKLSRSYAEGSAVKPVALIDSFNYLEVALNGDSAKNYLSAGKGAKIKVERC